MSNIKNKINEQILRLHSDFLNMKEVDLNSFLNRISLFNKKTAQVSKTFKTNDVKILTEIAKGYFTNFPGKKIALVGDTRMNIAAVAKVFGEFGIPAENHEFLNEYLDHGRNGHKLESFYNNGAYAGILIGPIAHSVAGKSGTSSSFAESPIPVIMVRIGNKRPKITKEALRISIASLLNQLQPSPL